MTALSLSCVLGFGSNHFCSPPPPRPNWPQSLNCKQPSSQSALALPGAINFALIAAIRAPIVITAVLAIISQIIALAISLAARFIAIAIAVDQRGSRSRESKPHQISESGLHQNLLVCTNDWQKAQLSSRWPFSWLTGSSKLRQMVADCDSQQNTRWRRLDCWSQGSVRTCHGFITRNFTFEIPKVYCSPIMTHLHNRPSIDLLRRIQILHNQSCLVTHPLRMTVGKALVAKDFWVLTWFSQKMWVSTWVSESELWLRTLSLNCECELAETVSSGSSSATTDPFTGSGPAAIFNVYLSTHRQQGTSH